MGKIKVINAMEVDPIEMEGLGDDVVVRPAIGSAQGSDRIQILHSIVEEGFEAESSPRDDQDEVDDRAGAVTPPGVGDGQHG